MTAFQQLTLLQHNDEVVDLTFTDDDTGLPYAFPSGTSVEFFIKSSQTTPDTDTGTIKLSTETGEITITDAANGKCQVAVPASATSLAGHFWWRADAVGAGGTPRKTGVRGVMAVTAD
jgi:hypothetical protein